MAKSTMRGRCKFHHLSFKKASGAPQDEKSLQPLASFTFSIFFLLHLKESEAGSYVNDFPQCVLLPLAAPPPGHSRVRLPEECATSVESYET